MTSAGYAKVAGILSGDVIAHRQPLVARALLPFDANHLTGLRGAAAAADRCDCLFLRPKPMLRWFPTPERSSGLPRRLIAVNCEHAHPRMKRRAFAPSSAH